MADIRLAPGPEQRRIAAESFDRARQVMLTGNLDYAIQLLLSCCRIDPANLIYRKELRRAQKNKHKNKRGPGLFAFLKYAGAKAKLRSARRGNKPLEVLHVGEMILSKNPWDKAVQLEMGEAADDLGLHDVGIFILEQAREADPADPDVNRALARLLEKRGHYAQAIKLWELVRQKDPTDLEASTKAKDLAASETIRRGHYEESAVSEEPMKAAREMRQRQLAERAPHNDMPAEPPAEPTEPRQFIALAQGLRKHGKSEDAAEVLRKGLATLGPNFEMQAMLAELEIEPFRTDLQHAEQRLAQTPDDAEALRHKAHLMKEINARELELYRMKADRFPGEMANRLELGIRLLRAGQTDAAIAELQQARKDDKLAARALLYLGHGFKARQNWKLAERNFAEALEKTPATDETARKDLLFQLASGSAEAGDYARAVDFAHELANLDFTYRKVNQLLDEWQAKAGRS